MRLRTLLSAVVLLCILALASCTSAPPLRDPQGNFVRGGIASLEQVTLGGDPQWISIRGWDMRSPIILFLHGGPGSPEIPLTRYYLCDLEQHFVFVNWDQRGAGKSYPAGKPEKMSIDRFVEDTRELTEYLEKRFHQKKIYVLGHSWGTLLGVLTVTRYPDLYYAYGGIGQYVEGEANERLAYSYTMAKARETGKFRGPGGARRDLRLSPPLRQSRANGSTSCRQTAGG